MLKTYAVKLEERQIEALKKLSQETKIPPAELLRQAVDLLLEKWQRDRERLEFLKRVDEDLEEDRSAMERLSRL
ncbi:ribbon-helix-helix domain-containing protein [Thermodesulforhabdus norvegica]|uniref:Ribbon-helix-helix domain-containing protein n=1 Tax=Thermodesulforhabdus norvegica TaxID=39841 RepID=A0A1I4TW77_9BACT|nr:ribbon-helix-helix domain-containing protein [Thermodesulforhabdus norvegica]SFM81018.1 Ribbon-helix-helix domain-containing protein [Thermodesulforhabdus norvegica]